MTTTAGISATKNGRDKTKIVIPKGSEVKVISQSGDVYICEYKGVKFPINKQYLK